MMSGKIYLFKVCLMSLILTTLMINAMAGELSDSRVKISVYADRQAGELTPIWRFFGYDEANYTFTPEGKKRLAEISRLSSEPDFIRSHHLLTSGDGFAWLKW